MSNGPTSLGQRLRDLGSKAKRELAVYRAIYRHPDTPRRAKVFLGLAIGYLLLPFDLIPDFIPVLGHVDDALIVPALIALGMRSVPDDVVESCRLEGGA